MSATFETRQLRPSKNMIWTVIRRQAGSLGKALTEAVMNSIDAGATSVKIDMDAHTVVIADDGCGFESREQIESWFEEFGFDHAGVDRTFGEFGMGRGQLWNWCATKWKTRGFQLDVDVQKLGLDYVLGEGVEYVDGLVIEGAFYTPLTTQEIVAAQREVSALTEFVRVPVYFNGKRVSRDFKKVKWSHETDDAWILLEPSARFLSVYNIGVKVRDFYGHQWGSGGVVVTKRALALNVARNDIIVTQCEVWKRIRKMLQKQTDCLIKRAPRLSEEQLTNLAMRYVEGEIDYEAVRERKLITDVVGKNHTLAQFMMRWSGTLDGVMTWVPKNEEDSVAEKSHTCGHVFVLAEKTMRRFGVTSAQELLEMLRGVGPASHLQWDGVAEDDWRNACTRIGDSHDEVPRKDWTKRESVCVRALEEGMGPLSYLLSELGVVESDHLHHREIRVGVSASAQAWTDGESVVWFRRELLESMNDGLQGVTRVVLVLVHEMLHESPSTGTHVHDGEFYERFEKAATAYLGKGIGSIGMCCDIVLKRYVKLCIAEGLKYGSKALTDVGTTEKADRLAA